jgi:hypothetical protein
MQLSHACIALFLYLSLFLSLSHTRTRSLTVTVTARLCGYRLRVLELMVLVVLALPGFVLGWPVALAADRISRRKASEAVAGASVIPPFSQ